jgi:CRP-like cAMP-binding protein
MNAYLTASEYLPAFTAETLPDHPLFRGLCERHRQILAECSARANFNEGEKVVETGDSTNCFYLVISGSIGLKTPGARTTAPAQTVGPGEILGWSWLFPPDSWQFDATACEATEVVFFQTSRLSQECNRDNGLGYELFRRMAQRRCSANGKSMPACADGATSIPTKTRRGRISFPSPKLPQPFQNQSTLHWPHVLFDTARTAFKYVGGATRLF